MPRKLPILPTLREVFVGTTQSYLTFLSASRALVAVLAFGIALIVWSGYRAGIGDLQGMVNLGIPGEPGRSAYGIFISRMSSPEFYAGFVIGALASLFFVVRWHRYILLGEPAPPPGRAHRHYVWVLAKVGLVYGLFLAVLIYLTIALPMRTVLDFMVKNPHVLPVAWIFWGTLGFFRNVVSSAVSMRLWLVLPEAAVEGRGKVFQTFMASHGNTWRLVICDFAVRLCRMVVLFGLAVLCGVASGFVFEPPGKLKGALAFGVLLLVGLPAYLYFLMLEVGLLSVAYREIVGLPGGHEGEATVAEPSPGL